MSELDCSCNRLREAQEKAAKWDAIVRCGECKHMHAVRHCWLGIDVTECWLHADSESGALGKSSTQPDDFCAWGERRDA